MPPRVEYLLTARGERFVLIIDAVEELQRDLVADATQRSESLSNSGLNPTGKRPGDLETRIERISLNSGDGSKYSGHLRRGQEAVSTFLDELEGISAATPPGRRAGL